MIKEMTDEELIEFVKKQEAEILKKPSYYIHYDPLNYYAVTCRNYHDNTDERPFIELSSDSFDFKQEDFNIAHYKVNLKDRKLEKIIELEVKLTKIDDVIYEIPKSFELDDKEYDLIIEQNNIENVFKIKMSEELHLKYCLQDHNKQLMSLYVTAPNDPNILYKTLRFMFGDLVRNEYYIIPFDDFKGAEANIYAFKYFEEYVHVDIR